MRHAASHSAVTLIASLVVASAAFADESYYGASIDDLAGITIAGVDDGTTWQIVDLDAARVAAEGFVDRFGAETVSLGTLRHFALHTSAPIVAYLGRDCCALGGTTFVPTAQGHARAGRVFVLDFPVLALDALRLFAFEDADLTVQQASGAVAVRRHVNAGDVWIAWGLAGDTPYLLRSTGDVILQLNVGNGDESVPPAGRAASCDQDVGDTFVLATHRWATGSVAVFAYEDADVSLTRVGELLPVVELTMAAGTVEYVDDLGLEDWLVRSTGPVAVWTGDTEGGDGIAWMGDDVTQNVGDRGRDVLVHTQTHGATVFAAVDATVVEWGEGPVPLDRDGFVDLALDQLVRVTASQPVLVQTSGGNDMNDWGTFLRPVPKADAVGDCADRADIEIELPVDAGPPLRDASLERPDAGAELDAGAALPVRQARGGGCSCRVTGGPPGGGFGLFGSSVLFTLALVVRPRG